MENLLTEKGRIQGKISQVRDFLIANEDKNTQTSFENVLGKTIKETLLEYSTHNDKWLKFIDIDPPDPTR